ncbi:FMN-binding protein [Demequina iriomotensis]|uniref:FMN-binding protein n=1 Tax=Demequina iriomotensis TaxID=1536641 RepID=UPI000785AA5A|nr:FMN-binding protein [Demequina iriomotensis]
MGTMKRSSGIIVTGISATLLSTGAVLGSGLLSPDAATTSTADAAAASETSSASTDAAATDTATPAPSETTASSETATPEATAASDQATAGTYDGEAVSSRYGTFQAEITVEDGQITAIDWLQSGEADHHSQQINDYAMPVLEDAILEAQDVNVGYVSGASYTSEAVEEAVYSAMEQAGLA